MDWINESFKFKYWLTLAHLFNKFDTIYLTETITS